MALTENERALLNQILEDLAREAARQLYRELRRIIETEQLMEMD